MVTRITNNHSAKIQPHLLDSCKLGLLQKKKKSV